MSAVSSSYSVIQEKYLTRKMHKTPGTPIKAGYQVTPKKSESKRSLFQTNSPNNSDDLGLMSPLSSSSCSSNQSLNSPQFSPNGKFSTPPKTPDSNRKVTRSSPRLASKKIEVKSSLFPDLKLSSFKSKGNLKTSETQILMSKMFTPQSNTDSFEPDEELRSLTPSSLKHSGRDLFGKNIIYETDSSSTTDHFSQESTENSGDKTESDKPTKLGIKPLSCESFYGPVPQPAKMKARTRLFIDTLEPRSKTRELIRSVSKESLSSNRSFVSGGSRKKSQNNVRRSRSKSNSDRRRAPHVGVWHNIKKPKQIKKIVKAEKPIISPKSRLGKMLHSPKDGEIKVKSKPLFQENPRKRVAHSQKRNRSEMDESNIVDSFPDHLIKRKKLPTPQYNVHPAINKKTETPEVTPDPSKKFLKYGQTRKAVFTLSDNVKLQISDGVMKLQSPKKRRKLYTSKKDIIEDFIDFEELDNGIGENIEGILNRLQNDKEIHAEQKEQLKSSCSVQIEKLLDGQSLSIDTQKLSITKNSPTKVQRSPLKIVSNLSTLVINDFNSDDNDENSPNKTMLSSDKKLNETTLEKTGNMISYMTNILVNNDDENDSNTKFNDDETENSPPNDEKYYSLFYKENWDSSLTTKNTTNTGQLSRKKILVPDDQYLLDAGQNSIGIVTCKKCGVMYQAGDFADEATHNNFHYHLPELRFAGWNNERVVGRYPDGRIIMILNGDSKIWWQKVSKIVEIVDQELGFPEASVRSLFYKTVYLFINEKSKQIAGCLIAEECKEAYRMYPPLEGVEIDSCSKDPSPCKVGISRIWTALSHRRNGVASRMIECLQKTFVFGEVVPMDLIAFSVPSPSGKLLAQKVTGRLDFLVYGFV